MFCDFCECEDCRLGTEDLYHSKTVDNKYICDICYNYSCCTNKQDIPCTCQGTCKYRPEIIGGFHK